jgi:peroxiredoxin Q/BCP
MLSVGAKAPVFALTDKDGKKVALKDLSNKFSVVYFYPKDDTPGCTLQAIEFTGELEAFKKRGAAIIGISGGDDKSKSKFCAKHKLGVTLLSDPDFGVAKKFGAYGEKSFMGRKFNGIFRSTFVLDKDKRVLRIFDSVSAKGHAEQVLKFLDETLGRTKSTSTDTKASFKKGARKVKTSSKVAPKSAKVSKKGATARVSKKGRGGDSKVPKKNS